MFCAFVLLEFPDFPEGIYINTKRQLLVWIITV